MIFGEEGPKPMDVQPQQVSLDAAGMETVYANFFALAGTPDELVVYLGAHSPLPNAPQPVVKVSHRVMLLPPNAKRLMLAMQHAVKAHEDRFGPIELPPHPPQGGSAE